MKTGDRSGFTIIELLVVAVLGTMIVLSIYQVLITNQRTYTAGQAQIVGQQSVRAGLDILTGELREISASGGDLIDMRTKEVWIRRMTAFGLVCAVNTTAVPPRLTVRKVGPWFTTTDSLFIFADNQPAKADDDVWLLGLPSNVDTTSACTSGDPAQVLSFPGMALDFLADTVRVGAPVRAFTHYNYALDDVGGELYLTRSWGPPYLPMVGPLASDSGPALRFEVMDSLGNKTTVMTDVRQIRVTLKTQSPVRNSRGEFVADSISAVIQTRN